MSNVDKYIRFGIVIEIPNDKYKLSIINKIRDIEKKIDRFMDIIEYSSKLNTGGIRIELESYLKELNSKRLFYYLTLVRDYRVVGISKSVDIHKDDNKHKNDNVKRFIIILESTDNEYLNYIFEKIMYIEKEIDNARNMINYLKDLDMHDAIERIEKYIEDLENERINYYMKLIEDNNIVGVEELD